MKNKLLILLSTFYFLLSTFCCFSQHKEGYNWITGTNGSRVSFITTGNVPTTFKVINYNTYFTHGHSCISDSNGNLLFNCDGFRVWDTMGNIIQNGDSLVPDKINFNFNISNLTQGSLILPFDSGIYKIFTPTVSDTTYNKYWTQTSGIAPFDLLLMHTVDMKANNGAGKIIEKKKEIIKDIFLSKSHMQACRHSNGKDWWLLKQGYDTNIIYTFLVKQDTIMGAYIQNFAPYRFGITDNFGQACFNKDGTKYAVVQPDSRPTLGFGGIHFNGQLMIANFNRCNGEISNPKYYNVPNLASNVPAVDTQQGGGTGKGDLGANGVAFSENGQFVYVAKFYNIMQFDLNEPDSALAWYHVADWDTINHFQGYMNMYIAPNEKIYVGNWNGQLSEMSVIDSPNNKGSGCGFCPKCLRFPNAGISSPPNMPDYTLGADLSMVCFPLQNEQLIMNSEELIIYPNPTSSNIYIKHVIATKEAIYKQLYNSVGQLLFTTKENEIDVRNLPKGIYFLKVGNQVKKFVVE